MWSSVRYIMLRSIKMRASATNGNFPPRPTQKQTTHPQTSCCVVVKMCSSARNIMLRSSKDVCKKHHVASSKDVFSARNNMLRSIKMRASATNGNIPPHPTPPHPPPTPPPPHPKTNTPPPDIMLRSTNMCSSARNIMLRSSKDVF